MADKKLQARMLAVLLMKEYADYLYRTKGKDFDEKLQKQLEKDSELPTKDWLKKYRPWLLKIKNDTEFDKYCEEKPMVECECGSANVSCIGLGEVDKELDVQMFKWKCYTCGKEFEISINEEGKSYDNSKNENSKNIIRKI